MRRYLIVDDNEALAENVAEILRDAGDQAVVAHSGPEALELLRQESFDALLTDMRMPGMDGAALVREARSADPGLPAIVITAFTRDAGLSAMRAQAPLAVLPKPVPVSRLLELLARARRDGLVAIVEDDAALAENLEEVLRDRGFGVLTACSLEETAVFEEHQPFAALVDLRLPGAPDGEALLRLARRFPRLPLIVITAHRDAPPSVPPRMVFQKPFATADLVAAVEALYESRRG
jgi:two-component system, response regulator PdtaR